MNRPSTHGSIPTCRPVALLVAGLVLLTGGPALAEDLAEARWAIHIGGVHKEICGDLATLPDGGFVVVGAIGGEATLIDGASRRTILPAAGQESDILVARFGPGGIYLWHRVIGGNGEDRAFAVAALPDGGCVVTGNFRDTVRFDDDPDRWVLVSSGGPDIFVAAFDPGGDLRWARSAGCTSTAADSGRAVAVGPEGEIYVTGEFGGVDEPASATFGEGEPNQAVLESGGGSCFFLARFDLDDGNLAWATQALNQWQMGGSDVAVRHDGSPLVTGYFYFEAVFPRTGSDGIRLRSDRHVNGFLANYTRSGEVIRAHKLGGLGSCTPTGMVGLVDESVVICGGFNGAMTLGAGGERETRLVTRTAEGVSYSTLLSTTGAVDGLVACYRADGTFAWARQIGGTGDDTATQVASLPDGGFAVVGTFERSATVGDGAEPAVALSTWGFLDTFTVRYGPDGSPLWVAQAGGSGPDQARAVLADPNGGVIVAGSFEEEVRFTGSSREPSFKAFGGEDIFIVKYGDTDEAGPR